MKKLFIPIVFLMMSAFGYIYYDGYPRMNRYDNLYQVTFSTTNATSVWVIPPRGRNIQLRSTTVSLDFDSNSASVQYTVVPVNDTSLSNTDHIFIWDKGVVTSPDADRLQGQVGGFQVVASNNVVEAHFVFEIQQAR